ncbi:MAG: hypothetical protein BWX80_04158 [Candidatus Hydrogenedentes bacterium ADurb.Bin101]|nr:MAG: hypothetical protein BWX80_04158 [Candidatus Hydrogenedentes bacterium ADurb.Bin101]
MQSVIGEAGRIDLSWEASAGATGYKIYRRPAWTDEAFVLIGETADVTYLDATAPPGYGDYAYPDGCFAESMDCMGCINSDSNPGCYYTWHGYGQQVEYYVTAYNACGESLPSEIDNHSAWKNFSFKSMLLRNGDSLLFLGVLAGLAAVSKRFTKGLALPM